MRGILLVNIVVLVYSIVAANAIGPLSFGVGVGTAKCEPSVTTASGPYATHKGVLFVLFNVGIYTFVIVHEHFWLFLLQLMASIARGIWYSKIHSIRSIYANGNMKTLYPATG